MYNDIFNLISKIEKRLLKKNFNILGIEWKSESNMIVFQLEDISKSYIEVHIPIDFKIKCILRKPFSLKFTKIPSVKEIKNLKKLFNKILYGGK